MDMPKPGAEQARLFRLLGEWNGDEVLSPSPWGPGGAARGRFAFKSGLDGMALLQDYEEEKDGRVVFRGHGVFLIEPGSNDVLWWWFDSFGFPPEVARGRWDGDVLNLEKSTPRGEGRYRFDLSDGTLGFAIENRFQGQADFAPFMHGRYTRSA